MSRPLSVDGIREFADRFDAFIIDQWGVLHDGAAPYPGSIDALQALHERGKKLVLLTNSGRRASLNRERMTELGFDTGILEGIVTSGEAAWKALSDRAFAPFDSLGRRCYLVTSGNDTGPVEGLDIEVVDDVGKADFLYFTFLQSSIEDIPRFDPLLERALERRLPFLCSNPDRVAVNAGGMTAAPGSIAARYETMGGEVAYVGKPHRPIYTACLAHLDGIAHDGIVCIGDSIEHDIKGANDMGFASCFIRNGIHRDAFGKGVDEMSVIDRLTAEHGGRPDFALADFRW